MRYGGEHPSHYSSKLENPKTTPISAIHDNNAANSHSLQKNMNIPQKKDEVNTECLYSKNCNTEK
jgi:hypothetical protein